MLKDSREAILGFLVKTFPEVDDIYIDSTPEGFRRPCFYVGLITTSSDHLSCVMHKSRATWQIVYFAPVNKAQNPDALDQDEVAERTKIGMLQAGNLFGPSGTAYTVLDCTGGPRDSEVYINVRLEAEYRRPEETEYEIMGEINHVLKEGN